MFLKEKGCPELLRIDRKWGIKPGSKGDIDILVSGDKAYLAAEVKTRLIPHSVTRWGFPVTKLMLQYHLDEPSLAERAWESLMRLGIVVPPKVGRRGSYDNPASISELARSVTASYLNYVAKTHFTSLIPSVITACYAKPFLNQILESVGRTQKYLEMCGVPVEEPAVITVKPNIISTSKDSLTTECYGGGCDNLNTLIENEVIIDLHGECPQYLSCDRCKYQSYCRRFCR